MTKKCNNIRQHDSGHKKVNYYDVHLKYKFSIQFLRPL